MKVVKIPEMEQKVLDATDNEPWGPHGTALAEIAQATKKFSECQMVMGVLWTRLTERGKDWRYVYKALAVIDYLISNGSERAVDEIIEHRAKYLSSLTSFEYVEPNGKDVGINVRKKAENIVALLNNKEKISEIRDKATINRNKYVGLSSTGISYKSGSASFGGSFQSGSSNYDRDSRGKDKGDSESFQKSSGVKRRAKLHFEEKLFTSVQSLMCSTDHDNLSSGKKSPDSGKHSSIPSHASAAPSNNDEDFDDFDPRGTSSNIKFGFVCVHFLYVLSYMYGFSFLEDLFRSTGKFQEADLFADASFVSASSPGTDFGSQTQKEVDLFSVSETSGTVSSAPPTVDLFASPETVARPEAKIPKPEPMTTPSIVDPFAAVPMENFDGTDPFGAFTSHSAPVSTGPQAPVLHGSATTTTSPMSLANSKPQQLQRRILSK
ncbi:hypothetical protein Bca52824_037032 [Brassica carinata]|uniref:ENTH domain-containing protein n=1 Tax=Brassica carinata TaxID=52824 RepID=A0A8X7S608_BRACI|nr:hypothetical protein Bca52824_037032 [Brassica carinata]